jgi:hypothetical protein
MEPNGVTVTLENVTLRPRSGVRHIRVPGKVIGAGQQPAVTDTTGGATCPPTKLLSSPQWVLPGTLAKARTLVWAYPYRFETVPLISARRSGEL